MVEIENIIYTRNIEIPVYFVRWQNELLHIMNDMELMLPGGNNNEQPSTLTGNYNNAILRKIKMLFIVIVSFFFFLFEN